MKCLVLAAALVALSAADVADQKPSGSTVHYDYHKHYYDHGYGYNKGHGYGHPPQAVVSEFAR